MYTKKITITAIIITMLVVTFMTLNAFECVEIWRKNWFDEDMLPAGSLTKIGSVDNNVPLVLVIGIIQIILIWLRRFSGQIIGVIVSIIGVIYSLRIPLYLFVWEKIGGIMGGLASTVYTATVFGYIQFIVSWIIVVMQVILLVLMKKQRSKE